MNTIQDLREIFKAAAIGFSFAGGTLTGFYLTKNNFDPEIMVGATPFAAFLLFTGYQMFNSLSKIRSAGEEIFPALRHP